MAQKEPWHTSTPDKVLAQVVAALERLDSGLTLHDLSPDGEHRRIAHNCLLTIVRHQATLDWILGRFARRRVKARLRRVLHWGIAQVLYLHGLPGALITDTCVRFVKQRYAPREAGFVNAVLRQVIVMSGADLLAEVRQTAPAHIRLDLGPELYRRWSSRFSEVELDELSRILSEPAAVCVRLRAGAPEPLLSSCLTPLASPAWMPAARLWRCNDAAAFFRSDEYRHGDFYIQDPSTLLAPALLAAQSGERIADLCCAPGGKAVLLAEALAGHGLLVCSERSPHRLRRMRQNLSACAVCRLALADALSPPFRAGTFDALMLDVPCSNTGVIRRRPDVRWRFSTRMLDELVALQRQILRAAASLLTPDGGRLVYSTCSIEPEENREAVDNFLEDHPGFRLLQDRQLLPGNDHDGAYAALLVRDNTGRAPMASAG